MRFKTKLLKSDKQNDIDLAIDLLSNGKIVAIPTETVYGLAADAQNVDAVNKIFKAKERPLNHPLIIHIASFEKLNQWCIDIPDEAKLLANQFWPGPLTLVLKKKDSVNSVITGNLDTIAIRVPEEPSLLKILESLDTGLAAPSANPHKRISPTSAKHVLSGLNGKISAVLDGGSCQVGLESTILDLTQKTPRILRNGPVTRESIEEVLGRPIDSFHKINEMIPGHMKTHYQPYTKTRLIKMIEIEKFLSSDLAKNKTFGLLIFSDLKEEYSNVKIIKISKNKNSYAKQLYDSMHELDGINASQILIEAPPSDSEWADVYDRLFKATNSD